MGRSEGSRNRVFVEDSDGTLSTRVFDGSAAKGDPSLTLYNAVKYDSGAVIVSNGTQTDDLFANDEPISHTLARWDYEGDDLCTPRISGLLSPTGEAILSILKASNGSGSLSTRHYFEYPRTAGEARFISTYDGDNANPKAFRGEPLRIETPLDVDEIWDALNADTKVALYIAKFPLGGTQWNYDTVLTHIRNRHKSI
jgi:IMP cyclohydrolase